jgi:predicted nucleic acid-binding protein
VAAIVISDASPLIGLARVDGLSWLHALFHDVLVPTVVTDEGEAASIRLALAAEAPALLLVDERAGRAVAREHGLAVAGTAAVIGLAHRKGLIPSARAVFSALHASDFRIAPAVIHTVPKRCGERQPWEARW